MAQREGRTKEEGERRKQRAGRFWSLLLNPQMVHWSWRHPLARCSLDALKGGSTLSSEYKYMVTNCPPHSSGHITTIRSLTRNSCHVDSLLCPPEFERPRMWRACLCRINMDGHRLTASLRSWPSLILASRMEALRVHTLLYTYLSLLRDLLFHVTKRPDGRMV